MRRVITYIDGFNLYYGLKDAGLKRLYWLDVTELSRRLIRPDQQLVRTRYFTSRIKGNGHNRDDIRRQSTYLDALLTRPGLTIQEGHFLEKTMTCKSCGKSWKTHEEKMTDVNIAAGLLGDAMNDRFDTAFLISGDSDLTTPVRQVLAEFPSKSVVVAFPPKRHSVDLSRTASASFPIGLDKLRASQLPDTLTAGAGVVLARPSTWK